MTSGCKRQSTCPCTPGKEVPRAPGVELKRCEKMGKIKTESKEDLPGVQQPSASCTNRVAATRSGWPAGPRAAVAADQNCIHPLPMLLTRWLLFAKLRKHSLKGDGLGKNRQSHREHGWTSSRPRCSASRASSRSPAPTAMWMGDHAAVRARYIAASALPVCSARSVARSCALLLAAMMVGSAPNISSSLITGRWPA